MFSEVYQEEASLTIQVPATQFLPLEATSTTSCLSVFQGYFMHITSRQTFVLHILPPPHFLYEQLHVTRGLLHTVLLSLQYLGYGFILLDKEIPLFFFCSGRVFHGSNVLLGLLPVICHDIHDAMNYPIPNLLLCPDTPLTVW